MVITTGLEFPTSLDTVTETDCSMLNGVGADVAVADELRLNGTVMENMPPEACDVVLENHTWALD
jgi:hypothetical protein